MENISHGPLERSTCGFYPKRHGVIRKSTPWGSKSSFILICWMDLDLIVEGEPIDEGNGLVAKKVVDNLVDERGWEFAFGTSMVGIVKVSADANSSLVFVNGDGIRNP
jgi:hypothetical protein